MTLTAVLGTFAMTWPMPSASVLRLRQNSSNDSRWLSVLRCRQQSADRSCLGSCAITCVSWYFLPTDDNFGILLLSSCSMYSSTYVHKPSTQLTLNNNNNNNNRLCFYSSKSPWWFNVLIPCFCMIHSALTPRNNSQTSSVFNFSF